MALHGACTKGVYEIANVDRRTMNGASVASAVVSRAGTMHHRLAAVMGRASLTWMVYTGPQTPQAQRVAVTAA